jgi:hypothetical protein
MARRHLGMRCTPTLWLARGSVTQLNVDASLRLSSTACIRSSTVWALILPGQLKRSPSMARSAR